MLPGIRSKYITWKPSSADAVFCFWIFYIFKRFLPTKYKRGGKNQVIFFFFLFLRFSCVQKGCPDSSRVSCASCQTDDYKVSAKYWSHCNNEEGMKSSISSLIHCISQFSFSFVPFNVAFFRTFMAYSCPLSTPLIFLTRNTWKQHHHHHCHHHVSLSSSCLSEICNNLWQFKTLV